MKIEVKIVCWVFYKLIRACVYFDVILNAFNGTLMHLWRHLIMLLFILLFLKFWSSAVGNIHKNNDYAEVFVEHSFISWNSVTSSDMLVWKSAVCLEILKDCVWVENVIKKI